MIHSLKQEEISKTIQVSESDGLNKISSKSKTYTFLNVRMKHKWWNYINMELKIESLPHITWI